MKIYMICFCIYFPSFPLLLFFLHKFNFYFTFQNRSTFFWKKKQKKTFINKRKRRRRRKKRRRWISFEFFIRNQLDFYCNVRVNYECLMKDIYILPALAVKDFTQVKLMSTILHDHVQKEHRVNDMLTSSNLARSIQWLPSFPAPTWVVYNMLSYHQNYKAKTSAYMIP